RWKKERAWEPPMAEPVSPVSVRSTSDLLTCRQPWADEGVVVGRVAWLSVPNALVGPGLAKAAHDRLE
ncbi:MAG: hypothetical protein AAGD07_13320, partial [Planctomycetota bacterium]